MKKGYLLLSIFIFCGSYNFVNAQNLSSHSVDFEITEGQGLNYLQQTQYNPWTIHKKVSAFGLAGSMVATMVGALAMDDEYFATTVIPVVGPFITIARVEDDPFGTYRSGGKSLLTASGIVQSAFLVYFVTSIIGESNYRGRQMSGSVSITPTSISKGMGVSMNVRF